MVGNSYLDVQQGHNLHGSELGLVHRGVHEALEWLRQCWSPIYDSSSNIGTDFWEDQSVEWLQTSILTELEGTPRRLLSEFISTPDIQAAYIWIVRNLVCPHSP